MNLAKTYIKMRKAEYRELNASILKDSYYFEVIKLLQKELSTKNELFFRTPTDLGWDCPKSPINVCVYDIEEDPICDNCLYCHQPFERK